MRAVIYARYSSDLQRDASIEDQVEVCRRYIERQGWTLTRVFEDRALSGGSAMRPDYQKLLIAAGEGGRVLKVVPYVPNRVTDFRRYE